jgi:hypothetical protein
MSERCTDNDSSAHLLEAMSKTSTTRNMASPNAADASSALEPTEDTSAVTPKAVKAQKGPPPESEEGIWLRRAAIFSFWSVVVLLGLPIWWKTTAIYRAELPLQDMTDWAEGKVHRTSPPTGFGCADTEARYASLSSLCASQSNRPYPRTTHSNWSD